MPSVDIQTEPSADAGATHNRQVPGRSATLTRRALLAIAAGLLLFAGHPPLDWSFVGLVALAPLIALARDCVGSPRPLRAGLAWGLLAGLVFFVPLIGWVRMTDLVAMLLLALIQSGFFAVFVGGLAWWGRRPAWPLLAVAWWVALEAVRGAAPYGGFSWGILGYTQHDGPFLLVARTLGVLGVSVVLAGIAAAVEEAAHRTTRRPASGTGLRNRARAAAVPVAAGGAIAGVAALLTLVPAPSPSGQSVDVAAVQGFDVEGSIGRSVPRAITMAEGHLALTEQVAAAPQGPPALFVWPENAIDSEPGRFPDLADLIDEALVAAEGAPIVAGVITDGPTDDTWKNTMAVFDGDAVERRDEYVKRQPVPFAEFIPLRPLIGWYPAVRDMRPTDAVAGTETGVLDVGLDGVRVGAVICFESIFPRLVHSQVDEGANILVVATNNSSFGRSAMSDQHLAFSSLRAVETGRWVVHAALTGKSAIVAPDGTVSQETELFEQATVRADIPLVEGQTLATRVGDGVGWLALVTALGAFLGAAWRTRTGRDGL